MGVLIGCGGRNTPLRSVAFALRARLSEPTVLVLRRKKTKGTLTDTFYFFGCGGRNTPLRSVAFALRARLSEPTVLVLRRKKNKRHPDGYLLFFGWQVCVP